MIGRKPYCLYTAEDVALWKAQTPEIQDAWGRFCHHEAEVWNRDAIMGDHNTNTAYQWAPCSFRSWLAVKFPPKDDERHM